MRAVSFIRDLAANGVHHFTTADAVSVIGGKIPAVRAQLRRLKGLGQVCEPVRDFHVIVPPEYMRKGCPPAEHFIDHLMRFVGEPYYICLLSAAERHGAAHQRPQAMQVMVRRNRRAIVCGLVRVEFIARQDMDVMPVTNLNTPTGSVRYSSPEVTALELVGYPGHSGGLGNVATVLAELSDAMSVERLSEVARLCPVSWSQRLGYLLDMAGRQELAQGLEPYVNQYAQSHTPLRRAAEIGGARRNVRWKLIVNVDAEPDE